MNIKDELEHLTEKLNQQREEIELKLHLASMDAKDEWKKNEDKWKQFTSKAEEISDDTKETTDELINATKVIAEELNSAYQRIVSRLKD